MSGFRVWKLLFLVVMSTAVPGTTASQTKNSDRLLAPGDTSCDENPQFFPTEVFGRNQAIVARTYSRYLCLTGEKPLAECVSPDRPQVYRVLVEVPPRNAPVVVRLSIAAGGVGELVAKAGQSGGHPEILTLNRTTEVSHADVDAFLKLLDNVGFWSMSALKPFDIDHVVMGDTGWMLEGSREGRYHLVYRGASELGPLKDAVVFLVVSVAKVDLRSVPTQPARP